jgi:hypothetical protein
MEYPGYTINLIIRPDLLKRYNHGFQYGEQQITEAIENNSLLPVRFENDMLWKTDEATRIEKGFREITEKYNITQHYHDLLYYILNIHEQALRVLDYENTINKDSDTKVVKRKAKEIAKLLMLYNDNHNDRLVELKFTPRKGAPLTVKSKELNQWLHTVIKEALNKADFPIDELANHLLFVIPDKDGNRDMKTIAETANMPIPAIGVAYTKAITELLLAIHAFVTLEEILVSASEVRYSNESLKFLYETAVLFNWLSPKHYEAEQADYIQSLFANYMKRNSLIYRAI